MTESVSLLGKPGYRQKDNLKMDLTEIGWEYLGWIYLTWASSSDRLLFTWFWKQHKLWQFPNQLRNS